MLTNVDLKEDDDLVDCNNKAPNTDEYKVDVNDNYERIEVVEGYNDENKSIEDYPNHGNVEEENPKDLSVYDETNVLEVVATQDVQEFQEQKIPKEQLETSSSDKDKKINHLKSPNQTQINETNTLKDVSTLKVHDKIANEDTLNNRIVLSY